MTPNPARIPPAVLTRLATALIPPDAREHLVGDLCERYTSPGRFIADVLRGLPFALATRIRRTTVFGLWPFLSALLVVFLGAGPAPSVWLRGLVPTFTLLIAYMFRDAYRVPDPTRRVQQGLVEAALVVASVAVSQALVVWLAPAFVMTRAGAIALVAWVAVLTWLRALNPARNGTAIPRCTGAVSLDDLRKEVSWHNRAVRRGGRVEIAACLLLLPFLAAGGLLLTQPMMRFASTLTFVCVAYVAWYVWNVLRLATPVPADADFSTTLAAYRIQLQRGHLVWRTYWRWYLLPLGMGPAVFFASSAMTVSPWQVLPPVMMFAVLWTSLARWGTRNASRLRQRIEELDSLTEA